MRNVQRPDEVGERLVKRAEERAANPKKLWGITWGDDMPRLNLLTGGIQAKKLYVLISRPNAGKSGLAAKWALNVARDGSNVKVATFEMSADSYQHRIACFMAGVPIWRIDTGSATDEQRLRYAKAHGELARLNITYLESAESFEEMENFFRANGGMDFGVIDHIGIIPGFYGSGGYTNAASTSIRVAKLAHTFATLLVLGHQNRQSLSAEDKRPTPESVAGSDQITRDADLIFGLYRPDMFVRIPEDQANDLKPGELLILKNRDGAAGRTIHMIYSPQHTDWKENPELNNGGGSGSGEPLGQKEGTKTSG